MDTFKDYLISEEFAGNYTSDYVMNEGLFDKLLGTYDKKKGYAVNIDFTKRDVIDAVVQKLKGSDALNDRAIFDQKIRNQISKYIIALLNLFHKCSGSAFVRPKGDSALTFVFEPYKEKNPQAYAQHFIDMIRQDDADQNIRFFADTVGDITDTDYTAGERKAKDTKYSLFNSADKMDEKDAMTNLVKDEFVKNVAQNIFDEVRDKVDANARRENEGEEITVYSVPFKVTDSLVEKIANSTKEDNGDLSDFYKKLVKRINDGLKDFLTQLNSTSNLDSYLGFIPVKTYGFNLYFKDRSLAEDAAEILNQDGGTSKVSERSRKEKRMTALPGVLEKSVTIGSRTLTGPKDGVDWFRSTLFAIEHVGDLVTPVFPGADDQVKIKTVRFAIDDEHRKKLGHTASDIMKNLRTRIKDALSTQKDLIVMSSDNNVVTAKFLDTASVDNIDTLFSAIFDTDAEDVQVGRGVMTQSEIDNYRTKFSEAMNSTKTDGFVQLFRSLVEFNADEADAEKAEREKAEADKTMRIALPVNIDTVNALNAANAKACVNTILGINTDGLINDSFEANMYSYLAGKINLSEATPPKLEKKIPEGVNDIWGDAEATETLKKIGGVKSFIALVADRLQQKLSEFSSGAKAYPTANYATVVIEYKNAESKKIKDFVKLLYKGLGTSGMISIFVPPSKKK